MATASKKNKSLKKTKKQNKVVKGPHKYIFVIGGVMSGVGKGIATASIGKILQSKGFKVNPVKVDPYLNVDAGTMNPTEHGEVFVLDSGLETDQDMGNYERFMEVDLTANDYMTSGMVYKAVIDRERSMGYKGKCVEAIPHVTEEITRRLHASAIENKSEISIVEIGGTVGDYQNILFIEAARVLKIKHPDDVIFIMVSYLPIPGTLGEMKTRPTQNAVRMLNSYGVQPDIIIARGTEPLDEKRKEKIAVSCAVRTDHVISAPDIKSVYDVPLNFERDKIGDIILNSLRLDAKKGKEAGPGLGEWKKFVARSKKASITDIDTALSESANIWPAVNIAVVGKYFDTGHFVLSDAYLSVIESIKYSCYKEGVRPVLTWVNSKDVETGAIKVEEFVKYQGIIVPGGFGATGIEGKIAVIKFARENKIPYFGLCYGMQLLVVEFARNVAGLKGAHTTEIKPDAVHPVIDIMPEQKEHMKQGRYGASMRLGAYTAVLKEGTIAQSAYGKAEISERHRHRFEVNPAYVEQLEKAGLVFSGKSPDGKLCEITELPINGEAAKNSHPFMLGTQFHPELKARPLSPHPLFTAFIKASKKRGENGTV